MTFRIIGGILKGRRVNAPLLRGLRPTTDFAKSGLFSMVQSQFRDMALLNVLDLFCGTGNISYEFASRGAASVVSADRNREAIRFVAKKTEELNLLCISPVCTDAISFLKNCRSGFDIVFADPPYEYENTGKIPQLVFENNLLKKDGWLIIEHSARLSGLFLEDARLIKTKRYGNVHFSVFS